MEKIKIALVDDDLTSRNTIKNYLADSDEYEVAADFQSGKTALEWLRKNRIDILLCDMQMPEMNGVELMRSVHIIDEYLPVVAISAFDDFNYIRGSLVNGAANYLLKHELSRQELLRILDQVKEKYRIVPSGKEILYQKGYCIYDEKEFQEETIQKMSQEEILDFTCQNLFPVAIGPDYKNLEEVHIGEYKQDISKAVIDMLNQILGENYQYLIYVTKKNHILVLISFAQVKSTLFIFNTIHNLVRRLKQQMIRMLDITATIATGEVHKGLKDAIEEALVLDGLLEDKLYLGGNRVVSRAAVRKVSYSRETIPESHWKQLTFEVQNHVTGVMDTVCGIFEWMEKERVRYETVLESSLKILSLWKQYGLMEEDERERIAGKLKEYEEFDQIRRELLEWIHNKLQRDEREEGKIYSPQVAQIMEYVRKHYTENISLEGCAELTNSSYTYLSREFKKETGMRFVEFLNRQRLNKAKSLLIRGEFPMKDIVELSGFRNYNYFFKVFKEMEGVTPSEFTAKK